MNNQRQDRLYVALTAYEELEWGAAYNGVMFRFMKVAARA